MSMHRFFPGFILLLLLFLSSGCVTQITNLTPQQVVANPSGIYTFSYSATFSQLPPNRLATEGIIVINGKSFQMSRSQIGENVFEYDYKMPSGTTEVLSLIHI